MVLNYSNSVFREAECMWKFKKAFSETNNENNRNQWIEKQLKSLPKGVKILDAGAGELKWKQVCNHLDYVSQDFGEYEGIGNGQGLQTGTWNVSDVDIISDITDIPVDNESFQAVLCSEVLEHLPNPELAIKEFGRILKKDGILILTAPFCSLTHFAPYHFCTGFNIYWYAKHLENYGFEIVEIVRNGNYFSYMRQELMRILDMEKRYIGKGSFVDKVAIYFLARSMKKVEGLGRRSNEILCFGYHVRAIKKY